MIYKKSKLMIIVSIICLLIISFGLLIIGNIEENGRTSSSAADAITAIYDFNDLKQFRDSVNEGRTYNGTTVYLHSDINMLNQSWTAINNNFRGTFDGQGYTIYNFAGQNGLFSTLNGNATIRNLNVVANGAGQGIVNKSLEGSLIQNCSMYGYINAADSETGGIVGYIGGDVESCQNFATITGNGDNISFGGIAGYGYQGSVEGCINFGSISGKSNVGGIVGTQYSGGMVSGTGGDLRIANCVNVGSVSSTLSDSTWWGYIGGIVGRNTSNDSPIYKCYNSENSGVKGAGVSGNDVGEDFTDESFWTGQFYCETLSNSTIKSYFNDSSKWNSSYKSFPSSYWTTRSNLNNGWPVLSISILTVRVNTDPSDCGSPGSFNIIIGDSVSTSGNTIRCNGYTMYTATNVPDTQWIEEFDRFSGVPSGAQYQDFTITAHYTKRLNTFTVTVEVSSDSNYGSLRKLGESSTQESIVINGVEYGSTISYSSDTLRITPPASGTGTVTQIEAVPDYDSSGVYTYSFDEWTIYPETSQVTRDLNIYASFIQELNIFDISFSVTSNTNTNNGLGGYISDGSYQVSSVHDIVYGTDIYSYGISFVISPNPEYGSTETFYAEIYSGYEFTKYQYKYTAGGWSDLSSGITLTGDLSIRAVFTPILYNLPLSFIANSAGTYRTDESIEFTIESTDRVLYTDISDILSESEKAYLESEGKDFGAWIIGIKDNMLVKDPTFTVDITSTSLEISNGIGVWTFIYEDILEDLYGNDYYCVTELRAGSYGDLPAEIITAKWSNLYDVEISNEPSDTIWDADIDTEYLGVGGLGEVEKVEGSNTKLLFTVKNNREYKYPFMSSYVDSTFLPFYKGSEYTRSLSAESDVGAYYIYNYGYEITNWTIYFNYDNVRYYLYVDGNEWAYSTRRTSNEIMELANTDMDDMSIYAERLDELLSFDGSADPLIYMYPTWQAVNVEIIDSVDGSGTVTLSSLKYGQPYTFDGNVMSGLSKTGKDIIYFNEERNRDIIAIGTGITRYNYRELSHDQYREYAGSNVYTDVIYQIYVEAYYVDNVYRVDLQGAKATVDGRYEVVDSDYTMMDNTSYSGDIYTYRDFGYTEYESGYIEEYTAELNQYRIEYEDKIGDGTLEPLRKVYGIGGVFHIYLANEQDTGDLPIFDTDYYDLIFWINNNSTADSRTYIYKTNLYDDTLHSGEDEGYEEHEDKIWKYEDGGSNKVVDSFSAYYFRKHYDFEVRTIFSGREGRYGYVIAKFTDEVASEGEEDKSGSYLAIYGDSEMEYYKFSGTSIPSDLTTLEKLIELPVLYAGCRVEIHIYDQSQDPELMDSGAYDELIGYRYIESRGLNINSGVAMFSPTDEYMLEITKEEIEGQNNITNTTYQVTASYEKIQYDTTVQMRDPEAGTFRITYPDGSLSAYVTEIRIQDMEIGDVYYITYNAYTGYEYAESAYTLTLANGRVVELQDRGVWEESGEQVYVMIIDGTWLRENYYTYQDPAYTVGDTDIGRIHINTSEIEFEYKIKVYDGSKTGEEAWIGEIAVDSSWSLSDRTINLSKAFSALSIGSYGYRHTNGEEYAIISSYIYEPRNPMNRSRYYASYDFLCTSRPTREYEINTDILYYMVNIGRVYEIVAKSARTIYMTIDVREIYRIGLSVEVLVNDTNSSTRITTISNGTNNTEELETKARATEQGGIYLPRGEIYTYNGLDNRLSSIYDERRYSGVEYYLEEVRVEGNRIAVEEDSELVIRYIPKAIGVEIRYELDGQGVDREALEGILTRFEVIGDSEVYLGNELWITYAVATDYNMRIEINGKELIGNSYEVQDSDYDEGRVEIVVKVSTRPNEEISIRIAQSDSTKVMAGDEEGEIRVYIDGEQVEGTEGIRVIVGKRVEVRIELNRGYEYYGYKHNNGAIDRTELTGNTLVLSRSFDVERESGEYRIYVSKEEVTAEMDQTSANARNYTIEGGTKTVSESMTRLTGMYVGRTITFNRLEELEREELRYYYYIGGDGSYIAIIGNELEITSEVLEEVGSNEIKVGVVSVNKYKLTIEVITGIENTIVRTDQPIEENGEAIYYAEGSEIEIEIRSVVEGKYTISTRGALEASGERIEATIELDRDKEIEVYVEAKRYLVGVEEYVYTSISEQESGEPSEESRPISEIEISGQRYQEQGVISFLKESASKDREISKIVIREEGKGEIEIEIKGGEYEIRSEEEIEVKANERGYEIEIGGKTYTLIEEGDRIEISYITEEDISLRLEYTMTKEIRP